MGTAVERINQTRQFITFLRLSIYKLYIKTSQMMDKKDVKKKQSVNIRDEFHFSDIHRNMNAMGIVQS